MNQDDRDGIRKQLDNISTNLDYWTITRILLHVKNVWEDMQYHARVGNYKGVPPKEGE